MFPLRCYELTRDGFGEDCRRPGGHLEDKIFWLGLALECVIFGHVPGINAGNEWTVRVGLNGSVSV